MIEVESRKADAILVQVSEDFPIFERELDFGRNMQGLESILVPGLVDGTTCSQRKLKDSEARAILLLQLRSGNDAQHFSCTLTH